MKKIAIALSLFAALYFMAQNGFCAAPDVSAAEPDEMATPITALLSPGGARLDVHQRLKVRRINGKPALQFVLPANAANLQLSVPGYTIARWSTTPVLLDSGNPLAGRRAQIEQEKIDLTARLMTVNSRLALWQAPPKAANAQEVINLQSAMQEAMPQLAHLQADLERRIRLINEELSRMPAVSDLGERVRVILAGDVPEGREIDVDYSYNHDGCGWEAVYDFNARPDEGSGDIVDVRLLAEVWQFTGVNWKDTVITLATKGFGPREPAPLPDWVIDSATPKPEPRARLHDAKAAMVLTASADAKPEMAPIVANNDTIYATWQLSEKGLPQGRSRMQITAAAWQAPLQWVARPSSGESQVWLLAKYDLPSDQAWPTGLAEYSVNGQNVGSGEFRPHGGEATLYFGADPRVSVITTSDSRKRGEHGFINASKTWTWAWTYTINNMHNKPIKVKVERPAPQIVDNDVTVAYKNDPAAQQDQKLHELYWLVDVPANGKKSIEHSVTLTSPTKLPLLPDVP